MAVSLSGTWIENTAKAWLVLELTGSPAAVGLAVGLTYFPVLAIGPWAGLVADRSDKRRLLIAAQAVMAVTSAVLGAVVLAGLAALWLVYVLSVVYGVALAFENPGRRSFIAELVAREDLANAVSLQSTLASIARTVGPAVAGLIIAAAGTGPAFLVNAVSYLAGIGAMQALDPATLRTPARVAAAPGQLREGLRYAATEPRVRLPLALMAVVGTLSFTWPVTVPLLTTRVFDAGPSALGLTLAAIGVGSVLGALAVAGRRRIGHRDLAIVTATFGAAGVVTACAPSLLLFGGLLVLTGAAGTAFVVLDNGVLQLETRPHLRGRVMALVSAAFIGSTGLGSPVVGAIAEVLGPRSAFAVGGVAALLAGGVALLSKTVREERPGGADPRRAVTPS